jgi:hypothetical protein
MKRSLVFLIAASASWVAGCGDDGISIYDIPKEKPHAHKAAAPASGPMPMPMPGMGVPSGGDAPDAGSVELAWKAPAAWTSQGASGMRLASFQVPGEGGNPADLSVTAFPGPAGGDLPNVNRWRGQVGLEAIEEAELNRTSTNVSSPAGRILVVDFTGSAKGKPVRLLGGVLSFGGKTWFFKLMGDGPVVGSAKPAFLAFLGTVHAK